MDKRKPIKKTLIVTNLEVADSTTLTDQKSTLNRSELSGKRAGSIVATYDRSTNLHYLSVAQGPAPADQWVTIGIPAGGGGSGGDAEVAHRVRQFALSAKEADGRAFKTNLGPNPIGKEVVIGLGGMTGQSSNVTLDRTNHTLTLPKMVTGYITYNGVMQVDGVIDGTTNGSATWVNLDVRYYIRKVGQPWPSAPSIIETVNLRTGDMGNCQFYSKKLIPADMVDNQEVQLRFVATQVPASLDPNKIYFGKDGWGTSFTLSSGQISNPDIVSF